ncbi:MAG: DUF2878 domain-containing protein [Planctomycetota bacterium]
MRTLLEVLRFQAAWFAAVLGAAAGHPWWGAAGVAALLAIHLATSSSRTREARVMGLGALVGVAVDGGAGAAGWLRLGGEANGALVHLVWFGLLWANFASTLNGSLAWLRNGLLPAIGLGALGGPLAYLAGHRLGAVDFPRGTGVALAFVAVTWTIATPLLARLAPRLGGRS